MNSPQKSPPLDIQKRDGVSAPQSFWNASGEKRARNWMYAVGETPGDKDVADIIFLCNLLSIISRAADESFGGWFLRILRERRAMTYYQAVASSSTGVSAFNASRLL